MRREQNLALVGAVVTGAVIATGLLMLLVARVNPDGAGRVRGAMLDVVTPVWSVVRLPVDGAARAFGMAGDYVATVDRNRRLESDLAVAKAQLQKAAADQVALRQLQRLMKARDAERELILTARIVAATSGSVVRTAMLAAGTGDGIGVGMPVIGADGLIGRTIEVGHHSTRVLLLTDPASRVPVIVQRTGQAGLAVGGNRPALELRDRVGAEEPLLAGDRLVTSGDGGIFPPGIPVGTIITSAGDPPLMRPAATPLGAGFVAVEAAYATMPPEPVDATTAAPVPVEARQGTSIARPAAPAPLP